MSLRRFRYKKQEYEQVLKWLKTQKVDEAEDEKSAEPLQQLGFRMPADYLPTVPWAHKAPMRTKVVEHGRIVIEVQLDGWKRLVHENEIDGYLRETLLSKKADVAGRMSQKRKRNLRGTSCTTDTNSKMIKKALGVG